MPSPNPDSRGNAESPQEARTSRSQEPFAIVRAAQVTHVGDLWDVTAKAEGTALRRLPTPITGKAVFELTLQAGVKREEGWQNGFLALGDSDRDDALLIAGLYIGRQSLNVFRGLADSGDGAALMAGYAREDVQRLTVTVDIPARVLVLECGDKVLRSTLPEAIRAVRYVGYHVIRTTTHFSEIVIRH